MRCGGDGGGGRGDDVHKAGAGPRSWSAGPAEAPSVHCVYALIKKQTAIVADEAARLAAYCRRPRGEEGEERGADTDERPPSMLHSATEQWRLLNFYGKRAKGF